MFCAKGLFGRRNRTAGTTRGRCPGKRRSQAETPNPWETNMPGLYFEDFEVGQEFKHPLTRTVTEMDNTMFSLL